MTIFRTILAILVGWMVSGFVIMGAHLISFACYRPDDGKSMLEQMKALKEDKEYGKAFIRATPPGGQVMVLLGWEIGAFIGGAISALIAARARVVHAAIIGAIVLAGTIFNAVDMKVSYEYGHPDWMLVLGLLLPLPVSMLAGKMVARRVDPVGAPALTSADGVPKR